MTQIYKHC